MSTTPRGFDASYDYIIIGAGSAGCALASRLSREASRHVLLLEAGGPDRHPMIHVPLGFAFLMKDRSVNWCYQTEPEPELDYRKIAWPRGKVVGGTSAINGMVYIRGQREDYEAWAAAGNPGWSYEEMLPWFLASEHNTRGADALHGSGGGLWVDEVGPPLECTDLFIQAGVSIGLPFNTDFNGPSQEGIGRYQVNVRNGVRQTAATSFLKPALKRANLELATHALAEKLLFDGERVTGVQYRRKDKVLRVAARRSVILCGGSINSPQLLELSGIGNPAVLEPLGITTRHALPGVGENLQDHLTINVQQGLRNVRTFAEETTPLGLLRNALRWGIRREGLLIHPACQAGAFLRTSPAVERPDAQIHFTPAAGRLDARGNLVTVPGTTATVCNLRPSSRGSVHVRTPFPDYPPAIRANYMSTEADRRVMIDAVRRVREIFASSVFDGYREAEIRPGLNCSSDEQILAFIRREAESVYHPVGTCAMGAGENAVVDHRLRVHGLEGLRIADASVIPDIISGNTNALCVAIGLKAAGMLIEDEA
ncbi:MAG: GMC family oxidoreductase N-terminal domain-containing protein [Pseudomonadales bacterium]|nr:GMC family oxidoreductase N-terminal domain-containing protein [Pseudomonadales bacterium]MBP7911728.1 GMC family oxidoreductase N-terminal domain-containing protein [Pseudomonadales bacterium]